MQKHLTLIIVMFFSGVVALNAQIPDYETFRRQQEQEFREFGAQRDSIMKQMNQEFDHYVEHRNKEYADYLKAEWERMQSFMGLEPTPGPKPDIMPSFTPGRQGSVQPNRDPVSIIAIPPSAANVNVVPRQIEPITVKPVDTSKPELPTTSIDFYGLPLNFSVDRSFRGIRANGINEQDVADWLLRASETTFSPTLIDLLNIAAETGMNDWALYMAAGKIAEKLSNNNSTGSSLYTWFLLSQAGYDIRLARQGNQLVLMLPFSHIVYNTPRLEIDGITYYIMKGIPGEPIYTYNQALPGAYRLFDMNFHQSPSFADNGIGKILKFSHDGIDYSLNLTYDPVLVAMLAEQPQAHMDIYLNANSSGFLTSAIEAAIEEVLQPMTELQKVSFMLKLSQTAFEYETDIDQFGIQKYMTPDEVVHYTNSDCDDRAVFFGWLVRNYAGLQVAALLYPGHLANAVQFTENAPDGDYVMIYGKKFIVADPTYIYAPVGLTMPDFLNVAPTAWVINSDKYDLDKKIALWQKLMSYGARRGNNQNDMVIAGNGQVFATGYFTGELSRPDSRRQLVNRDEKRTAFVGMFDADLQPQWLHAFESQYDATGFSMQIHPNGSILVAGSFINEITIQGRTLASKADEPDVFVASFSPGGSLNWVQQGKLSREHSNNALSYAISLQPDGQNPVLNYFNDPRENPSGLFVTNDNRIVLAGTFGNTSGLTINDAPFTASGGTANYAELLVQKNRELMQRPAMESTIAGLFAAIYLSKSEGAVFPGAAAQEAIRKANPRFPAQFPETFANIGKVSFLRNKSGIIEIRTEGGDDVFFDKMRIQDKSTIRIRSLSNGDEQIDILSNIHVGQYVVWYPLNFIRLNQRTGDLLFDYRSNNSQVTLNLKKDILN